MRGRPTKDEKKNCKLEVRMTEHEMENLKKLSAATGKNLSQLVKDGIRMVTNLHRNNVNLS